MVFFFSIIFIWEKRKIEDAKAKVFCKAFSPKQTYTEEKKTVENPSPKIQTNINKMLKYVLCIENWAYVCCIK